MQAKDETFKGKLITVYPIDGQQLAIKWLINEHFYFTG
jgi:hypothetical protein